MLDGLENDSDEIEDILFSHSERRDANSSHGASTNCSTRVIDFQRACRPLESTTSAASSKGCAPARSTPHPYPGVSDEEKNEEAVELARRFRNVLDHVTQTKNASKTFAAPSKRTARARRLLGQQQNDDTKRISAYAALLMVPTIVGSVYGMNFEVMPELKWSSATPPRCYSWWVPACFSTGSSRRINGSDSAYAA